MVPGMILGTAPAAGSNCIAQRSGTALDCIIDGTAKAVYNMSISNIIISLIGILAPVARSMALLGCRTQVS